MTTLTINAGSGDCYCGMVRDDIDTTGTIAYIGKGGADPQDFRRAWFPFANVTIPKSTVITSATLKMVANANGGAANSTKVGCEAADNPSDPATAADLRARTLSSAYTLDAFSPWVTGTQYSLDITTAVQEILNRAGWVSGNKLAVMTTDNGSSDDGLRGIATVEDATYSEAILEIVYALPSASQIIIF